VGLLGAGASETLSPARIFSEADIARHLQVWERLVDQKPDGSLYNRLAEDFSHNHDGSVWKIKLPSGVLFHDGSPFTAHDVVYSLKWYLNPANKAEGLAELTGLVTSSGIRARDRTTVELRLPQPSVVLPTILADRTLLIFKKGTTTFTHPIGTGPFKFVSWTPGERTLLARNPHYRVHGGPYVAKLELISITDPTARVNALLAGQIDALADLDTTLVRTVRSNSNMKILRIHGGQCTVQTMWCDTPPFDDNRVREAFRLMVNRPQVVANALNNYGSLGNDLLDKGVDVDYDSSLPQRRYDPQQAKALLKSAGHQNLTVTLTTSSASVGMLESSTLIQQQAQAAGVTINLNNVPADEFYAKYNGATYFNCSAWSTRSLDTLISQIYLKTSPFNETHWFNPSFDALYLASRKVFDPKRRKAMLWDLQRMLYQDGGHIIWGYRDNVDAISKRVHGITPSVVRALGQYDFLNAYLK
jgi:peptide/nickel transport system substrate-binding protein